MNFAWIRKMPMYILKRALPESLYTAYTFYKLVKEKVFHKFKPLLSNCVLFFFLQMIRVSKLKKHF